MIAQRKTPTISNGGSDNGVSYTNAVDGEAGALWGLVTERLINVGGSANALTATSDSAVVTPVLTIGRGKRFSIVPTSNNTLPTTIVIDDLGPYAIVDKDNNALTPSALVALRLFEIEFDGTSFRIVNSIGGSGQPASSNALNGGRLTVTSGTPEITTAVTAQPTLYWTPSASNQIALFDGISTWVNVASPEKSIAITATQTGNTHNGTRVIDGLTDTSQLVVGEKASGTGVGAGAVISTIDSPTQVTVSVNSTASAGVSVTFKLVANTGYDVYGKVVSNALKLFMFARGALFTPTANTLQDGVTVKSGDPTMRWLGWFHTSNTDGLIDYTFLGQYRFSIWNAANRRERFHCEPFAASGVWYKAPGTTRVKIDVCGAGGGGATNSANGSPGANTSFGAHVSASAGAGGVFNASSLPANGVGSNGDANHTGTGGRGGFPDMGQVAAAAICWPGGDGGRAIRTRMAVDLGTTETVTIGGGGGGAGSGGTGASGWVIADEVIEV